MRIRNYEHYYFLTIKNEHTHTHTVSNYYIGILLLINFNKIHIEHPDNANFIARAKIPRLN